MLQSRPNIELGCNYSIEFQYPLELGRAIIPNNNVCAQSWSDDDPLMVTVGTGETDFGHKCDSAADAPRRPEDIKR